MPSSGRSPSPQSTSPATRSLFSRFKAPFNTKTRHITEYFVQPDDPHRQYGPGDIIKGSVIVKVVKPIRVTHIVVCLHGYAQVYKNPNSPGEGYKAFNGLVGSGKVKKGGYFGNGFVSLFEDEVVLCGEGKLGEGTYQFNFELEFPRERLPTSIDFERGTVSYMVTSTLTRPTTIGPTTLCDRKVYFQDSIDIAPLHQPKPRVISLEPKSRRSRIRASEKKRVLVSETIKRDSGTSSNDGSSGSRPGDPTSTQTDNESPISPAPSEVSFESGESSCGISVVESGMGSILTSASGRPGTSTNGHHSSRTITASIELQKAGFLRGDNIPLKITVNHTKRVRSLQGIIVTLYRQARVDMHPALPLATSKGDPKNEDYYPKSRTGLGGLSLSSAGSSHVYRKDLSQSLASLIINPETLHAEIKTSVRVPEDAFPTIGSVPGAMITFKYYVEVVVDIQGKLTGLDKLVSNPALLGAPPQFGTNQMGGRDDGASTMMSNYGGHYVDTEAMRRDKNVISCVFEVIVGTKDSDRIKGKRRQQENGTEASVDGTGTHDHAYGYGATQEQGQEQHYDWADDQYHHHNGNDGYWYDDQPPYDQHWPSSPPSAYPGSPPGIHHVSIPIPNIAEEEAQLPEKERLRRHEERLLPSRPPDSDGHTNGGAESAATPGAAISVAGAANHAPSAPPRDDPYADRDLPDLPPPSPLPPSVLSTQTPGDSSIPPVSSSFESSSSPSFESSSSPSFEEEESL
ncbi:hypothetical protein K402DRAFT_415769 [Aulographum hederae CBS 113979]|uniref:Arrestin C-terminal-like domain-containing protein n=1 Tax=Aulographum hederae CBS 113979 TaxID=1176131 RepID=A0A6G1GIW4_9PEZI|nr:hypothetical protein K402DRAFT_415769 [Aulographum hederae CBS 113979]